MFRKLIRFIRKIFKKPAPPVYVPKIPTVNPVNNEIQDRYEAMYKESVISFLPQQKDRGLSQNSINYIIGLIRLREHFCKGASKIIQDSLNQIIPWEIIAVLHYRECANDMSKQILNGQSWRQKTTIVPKGFGPWQSFEESCVTAFTRLPYGKDKTLGQDLDFLERWNGLGYRNRKIDSPYLWSFTNIYKGGYYTSDGKFSSKAVNMQSGVVPILKALNYKEIV